MGSYLPEEDFTVRMCRLREIERPPSSVSSKFTKDASNASSRSSDTLPEDSLDDANVEDRVNGSMFHNRIVAS